MLVLNCAVWGKKISKTKSEWIIKQIRDQNSRLDCATTCNAEQG